MNIEDLDIEAIKQELIRLDTRIVKRLQEIGRKYKETKGAISKGKLLQYDVRMAYNALQAGKYQKMLDILYNLTQEGLKLKSVTFPADHKTFAQLREEDLKRNPEQLIKRSRSWGGGYRK